MMLLIAGILIFFSIHLIPIFSIKERLIERWGEMPYMGLFSLVAGLGLGLIIYGKATALFIAFWQPMTGSQWVPIVLMLPAFILISWAYVPGHLKNTLKHPMLMGVTLFSISHLSVNGDLASLLLFGSFLFYSLMTMARLLKKSNSTDVKLNRVAFKMNVWDVIAMVAGILIYALAFFYHVKITGVGIQF